MGGKASTHCVGDALQPYCYLERTTGFEPATLTLARFDRLSGASGTSHETGPDLRFHVEQLSGPSDDSG